MLSSPSNGETVQNFPTYSLRFNWSQLLDMGWNGCFHAHVERTDGWMSSIIDIDKNSVYVNTKRITCISMHLAVLNPAKASTSHMRNDLVYRVGLQRYYLLCAFFSQHYHHSWSLLSPAKQISLHEKSEMSKGWPCQIPASQYSSRHCKSDPAEGTRPLLGGLTNPLYSLDFR